VARGVTRWVRIAGVAVLAWWFLLVNPKDTKPDMLIGPFKTAEACEAARKWADRELNPRLLNGPEGQRLGVGWVRLVSPSCWEDGK